MGKTWVLDTETKGTGAQMVPIEKKLNGGAGGSGPVVVEPRRRREPEPAKQAEPRTFRVVDAMSRQVIADGTDLRETIRALEGARSVVDVSVWVWDEAQDDWRLLTFGERQALWRLRGSE
ncbi:MAG TPA: hypothetical protein VF752_16130 [Thermoleophilaceae bacterium]